MLLKHLNQQLQQFRLEHRLQVLVRHQQVPYRNSQGPETLQIHEVFGRIGMGKVAVNGLKHKGILREEEWCFCVDAEQQQHVDGVDVLLPFEGLERHDEVLDLRHDRIYFGALDEVDVLVGVTLVVVFAQFGREGGGLRIAVHVHCETARQAREGVTGYDRLSLPSCNELRQIGGVILPEEEALFVAEQVLLVVVLECEAGRGAGRGQSELVDDLLPQFVVGDHLPSPFLADGAVEFVEVELLPPDLGNLDLRDALARPVLLQVLLELVLLLQL